MVQVWDEDGKMRSSRDDILGTVVVPWKKLWPEEGYWYASNEEFPLAGKGAKDGSTITLNITPVRTSCREPGAAAAGSKILAESLRPISRGSDGSASDDRQKEARISIKTLQKASDDGKEARVSTKTLQKAHPP